VVGVEALARWYHPEFGHASPTEFIDVAERIGIIKPLTEWVLHKACHQVAEWNSSIAQPLTIAVNISPSFFLNNDIVLLVKQVLKDTGIKPCFLELEVTENVMQTDPKNLSAFKELKELGVRLAIDDFGVGYSSFASLKHIKIDTIKIDKYFIDDMLNDHNTKYLITSMIDIAHNFGYEIVAEGVETKEQLITLRELGCDIVQGHLFSKPVSESELLAWLAGLVD
jgi:EAL domain-containing protein (putative c-di-GMP-specific phosphodiesterase class I)